MEKEKEMLPTVIDFNDKKMVEVLRNTVAQGATDAEFTMFAELCKATGLNPFKKEVWFIKTKDYTNRNGELVPGKVQLMTGINGYLAIANRHPQFDGMETQVVRDDKGGIIKAVCRVYRKDRSHPSTAEAFFNEYYQKNFSGKPGIWDTKPTIMISKVAKSIALREAFPQELNGLYTEEEMPQEYKAPMVAMIPSDDNKESKCVKTQEEVAESLQVKEENSEYYYCIKNVKPENQLKAIEYCLKNKLVCVDKAQLIYRADKEYKKLKPYECAAPKYDGLDSLLEETYELKTEVEEINS